MNSKSDPICDNLKQISYHKGLGEFEHNPTTTEISVSWHVRQACVFGERVLSFGGEHIDIVGRKERCYSSKKTVSPQERRYVSLSHSLPHRPVQWHPIIISGFTSLRNFMRFMSFDGEAVRR